MYKLIDRFDSFLLVSLGAILGGSLRMQINDYFASLLYKRDIIILFINILATFLLGVFLAILTHQQFNNQFQSMFLLIGVGFLGSLSTFSTFILILLLNLLENRWNSFAFNLSTSLLGGIMSAFLGLFVGELVSL
tara:strand:- start:20756 stop:21160 length:405 start_codon:yes stop_codon:yes gene_type:complete